jgi:hypothetical protein
MLTKIFNSWEFKTMSGKTISMEQKEFMTKFKNLTEFYAIDFITTDFWNTLFPNEWKFLQEFDYEMLASLLAYNDSAVSLTKDTPSLYQFIKQCQQLGLDRIPTLDPVQFNLDILRGMSTKKSAEITSIAHNVASIAKKKTITNIIGKLLDYIRCWCRFCISFKCIGIGIWLQCCCT